MNPEVAQKGAITFYFKENLDYEEFLRWQAELTQVVRTDPSKKFVIMCNHPLLLTVGRGDRQNKELGLSSEIPPAVQEMLPVFSIKRGGGVTVHGPHQLIFYPILRLSPQFGLNDYLAWLTDFVRELVNTTTGIELEYRRNPLGLWYEGKKVASIGVGIDRLITNHGLALNVGPLPELLRPTSASLALNPCGLPSSTYASLADICSEKITIKAVFDGICQLKKL